MHSSLEIEKHEKIGPKIPKSGPQQKWSWCRKKWIDHQSITKNICTHFHGKILNGSQEREKHAKMAWQQRTWSEIFLIMFLVSVVTISVIPTEFHEKILNGFQEIEEHMSTWARKHPKMAPSKGGLDIFFWWSDHQSTTKHNFMIKYCIILKKERSIKIGQKIPLKWTPSRDGHDIENIF